ncbi:rhodanese-like domain-containing protein [Aeromicrobium tamlense]|uniref:Rhodanese-like domain-containing protein n=1 Tax=Aeromicrobium tamlense TaxID=375541 RepID=A0A8I0FVN9_9ACTN|nr:rhodanese-like domain-containing protein [Aeromicrobium tamlense]MBD1269680.1 rhodanese-like domain-containing protein [Aeromicrobium tamlense]NYI39665.1 rhodanese-related sulfurtransferase [Aeromicrobium tamlense]
MSDSGLPQVSVTEVPDPLPEDWVVLDVREPFEWEAGHIDGAVHVPLGQLPLQVERLDPQRPMLVVCHLGQRSAHATAWLTSMGHHAVNLEGGMDAWEAAGRPVVS